MSEPLCPGKYRHFRGKEYELLYVGKHSETLEEMVIYRGLYDESQIWVRPASMWYETVFEDGRSQPRFTFLEKM